MDYNYLLFIVIISLLFILCLSYDNNNKIEKFRPYYNGTRLCNNRGCDTRYVQDKGTYYCPLKVYNDQVIKSDLIEPLPANSIINSNMK